MTDLELVPDTITRHILVGVYLREARKHLETLADDAYDHQETLTLAHYCEALSCLHRARAHVIEARRDS